MNKNISEGKWQEIKGKIRTKFAKFTDDDLESFKGNLEQITGKIKTVYGYAQDKADKEYAALKDSFTDFRTEIKKELASTTPSIATVTNKNKLKNF
jgi:uncharacterized protein YjbJ (UPF0337 family)